MLEITDLVVHYGGICALNSVSLHIDRGDVLIKVKDGLAILTGTSLRTEVSVACPVWPLSLAPQQETEPSPSRAHVWFWPAVMSVTLGDSLGMTGRRLAFRTAATTSRVIAACAAGTYPQAARRGSYSARGMST